MGQKVKIKKMRYLSCPKCGSYTRIKMKERSMFALLLGGLLGSILSSTHVSESEKTCSKCANKENLKFVFLPTEIGLNNEEIAYQLPSGEKISLK